jgi:hypothetical protein
MTNLPATTTKINRLLALQTITEKDIQGLTQAERQYFNETTTHTLSELKGAERDEFLNKIDPILPVTTKHDIWEYNHALINRHMAEYVERNGIMPAKSYLARKTGLSRATITKHFREYKQHPEYTDQMEQFHFMAPNVLAGVYKSALTGNVRAARLYFDMIGANAKQPAGTVINEQKNYIQVNNTILSQENLEQLSKEQLNEIENIIRKK